MNSHSSAPEVFLAAASQRTERIRLAHGIIQLTTNHPARVAERVSTLDLLSHGRVEMGIGEGASTTELHPFDVRFRDKRAVSEDAVKALMPMFTSEASPAKSSSRRSTRRPSPFRVNRKFRLRSGSRSGYRRYVPSPIPPQQIVAAHVASEV